MIKHTAETPITEFWRSGPRTSEDMQKEIDELRESLRLAYLDMTKKRHINGGEFCVIQQLLRRK